MDHVGKSGRDVEDIGGSSERMTNSRIGTACHWLKVCARRQALVEVGSEQKRRPCVNMDRRFP